VKIITSPSLSGLRTLPVYGDRPLAFNHPARVMVETPSPAIFAKEMLVQMPASPFYITSFTQTMGRKGDTLQAPGLRPFMKKEVKNMPNILKICRLYERDRRSK
jgi:hypothetical protein